MPEGDRIGVLIMEEITRKEAISTPEYIKLLAERDTLKAENERLKAELAEIRESQRDAYKHSDDLK